MPAISCRRPFTVLFALGALAAGEAPADTTIVITLDNGSAPAVAGQLEGAWVELELQRVDGAWQPVAGCSPWHSRGEHAGTVASSVVGDALRLDVKLDVLGDKWTPRSSEATYAITLAPGQGTRWQGPFTGTFDGKAVAGTATAEVLPRYTKPREGAKPAASLGHPRLVFRRDELPALRARLQTPEGAAIAERMLAAVGRRIDGGRKLYSLPAADLGIAFQLTGDATYAQRARELLEREILPSKAGLSQDIHHAPYLQGVAYAFDWCQEAWEPAFRAQVVDWMADYCLEMHKGANGGGRYAGSPNFWANHNAIRNSGVAIAAICLLGEKRSDGSEIPGLDRIVAHTGRDVRRFLRYGLGETGWFMEGDFYKGMTLNTGPAHVVQAWRSALGCELLAGWPGAYTVLGELMETPPVGAWTSESGQWDQMAPMSLGADQQAGWFAAGMATVLPEHRAGLRWLFDRTYGLQGDRSFGFTWATHAAFVLANYPFDVAAAPPSQALPWAAFDRTKSHHLFRRPWEGADDALAVFHYRHEAFRGCHYERVGECGHLGFWALGRRWLQGPSLVNVGVPVNAFHGGATVAQAADAEGRASFTVDLGAAYLQQLDLKKGQQPPSAEQLAAKGQRLVACPRAPGAWIDVGIAARRMHAVDLSGQGGAAVLVIADRVTGGSARGWKLPLSKDAGEVRIDGATAIVGAAEGPTMRVQLLWPRDAKLAPGLLGSGTGDAWIAVITVQRGDAPPVALDGEGLQGRITVGDRVFTVDGDRLLQSAK